MWPDWVSNPGPLTCESGARTIALCGPATAEVWQELSMSTRVIADFPKMGPPFLSIQEHLYAWIIF